MAKAKIYASNYTLSAANFKLINNSISVGFGFGWDSTKIIIPIENPSIRLNYGTTPYDTSTADLRLSFGGAPGSYSYYISTAFLTGSANSFVPMINLANSGLQQYNYSTLSVQGISLWLSTSTKYATGDSTFDFYLKFILADI